MVVREWTVTKPSRSDEVLDSTQQLQITNQVRAQIEAMAPKRPAKPNRSESDTIATPPISSPFPHYNIPELDNLRSLRQPQSPVAFLREGDRIGQQDEFVETQYYKELDSIDKQHHTTGSGFIRVAEEENGNGYGVELPGDHGGVVGGTNMLSGYKSNPATNDWVPSVEDHNQVFVSSKPNRSESS